MVVLALMLRKPFGRKSHVRAPTHPLGEAPLRLHSFIGLTILMLYRCGAVMTLYKNKAIVFGGVIDEERERHTLLSRFYNDLYAFDMERMRWDQLGLRAVNTKAAGVLKVQWSSASDEHLGNIFFLLRGKGSLLARSSKKAT